MGCGKNHALLAGVRYALLAGVALLGMTSIALANEFPHAIKLSSLNGSNGFRLDGVGAGDHSGFQVSEAGDVNGDGFADVIVGALRANPGGKGDAGASYVVFGKRIGFAAALGLSTLDGTNGFRIAGVAAGDTSGDSVSAAGDVNGDGFGDVIIGGQSADPNGLDSGSSYVVFGKAGGFASSINLSGLNGSNGFRLDGAKTGDFSGWSVSSAGDVNGDGFADLIVGAPYADHNATNSGSSYVVFGKPGGFASNLKLSNLNGSNGFRLDGAAANDNSGYSVSGAGDVNGDGYADIIVGAPGADLNGSGSGASYVVFGKASGFASIIKLSGLNGSNGFRLEGIAADDFTGLKGSTAGDVNGDGYGDLIVGANGADLNGPKSGSSYVVFGKKSGFASTLRLSTLNGTNGFRISGVAAEDGSGFWVSAAGDVNGDGFADVIVGAPWSDPNGLSSGSSYLMFGRKSGFPSTVKLSNLNGNNGFRVDGVTAGDLSGLSVSGAGDVNGDGFADLIIGAFLADPNKTDAGSSYVVFGRPPDSPRTRAGSDAGQYISGGKFADTLSGLDGKDELEGRAGSDTLNGGSRSDTASYRHAPKRVTANLASPAINTGDALGDSYSSIENLKGSAFNDTLNGDAQANVITGGAGTDTMAGGGATDIFNFEEVSDSQKGFGRDKITDFDPGTSTSFVDRIDLSAIDANSAVGGNQAFVYRGNLAFTGSAGEIRIRRAAGNVIVEGNVNNDTVPDFEIQLDNLGSLANIDESDFIR